MNETAAEKKAGVRRLKKNEAVPCDGQIYRDTEGQLWFGLQYKLTDENRFIELLSFVEQIEKEGFK